MREAQRIRYVVYAKVGPEMVPQGETPDETSALAAARRLLSGGRTSDVRVDRSFVDPVQNRMVNVPIFEEAAPAAPAPHKRSSPVPMIATLVGLALTAGTAAYWLTKAAL